MNATKIYPDVPSLSEAFPDFGILAFLSISVAKEVPLGSLRDGIGLDHRDPTAGVKGCRSTEIHTWNEGEISVFEQRWPKGTAPRRSGVLGKRDRCDDRAQDVG